MSLNEPTALGLQFQILGLAAIIDGTLQMLVAKDAIGNDDVIRMLRQLEAVVRASINGQQKAEGSEAILQPIQHLLRSYETRVNQAFAN